jgi:hypothetical protein
MKKTKLLTFIFSIFICICWVIRGYFVGKKESDEEFKRQVSGKIINVYRGDDEKFCYLIFANSTKYQTTFWGIQNEIKVGDSIFKPVNSFKYIVYHNSIINDTSVYDGSNLFFK